MKLRRNQTPDAKPTVYVGDYTDKLMRLAPIAHDDDNERQCREDLHYGETLFSRPPVALPRFPRRKRKR
jgi:hypothetical protein